MDDTLPVKQSFQNDFMELHSVLLNVMDRLSGIANPVASAAVQDISDLINSLNLLQNKMFDYVSTSQHQLKALVGVGQVINSSLGLERVLTEVMDSVVKLMQAERGFLMLYNNNGELRVKASHHMNKDNDDFTISMTIVSRVANTGKPVLTTNAQEDPRFEEQKSVVKHNLRSIICVPLNLKDETIGVIFVDSRIHTALFREADLEILSAFADHAAVAIDNARLFDSLQKANQELRKAYDETLQGWALALELRDRETEGHTRRVTELTLQLAEKLGVPEGEMEHVKRGALLHDIGKMAIPDSVLLKPGNLNLMERKFMELHPEIAKDMLKKIEFLHPAISIPYCHHEKWDGTGYPHNLRGEEIPFAARIFAVVDVWDALTSERPYRDPVAPDEVRRIIHEGSGSHFDPLVVDAFLEIDNLPVAPRSGDTQLLQKIG